MDPYQYGSKTIRHISVCNALNLDQNQALKYSDTSEAECSKFGCPQRELPKNSKVYTNKSSDTNEETTDAAPNSSPGLFN